MIPFKNRYLKEKFTFTTTKRTKASKFHFLLILCFIFVIFFSFQLNDTFAYINGYIRKHISISSFEVVKKYSLSHQINSAEVILFS